MLPEKTEYLGVIYPSKTAAIRAAYAEGVTSPARLAAMFKTSRGGASGAITDLIPRPEATPAGEGDDARATLEWLLSTRGIVRSCRTCAHMRDGRKACGCCKNHRRWALHQVKGVQ